jgi:hypothetical protein
MNVGMTTKSTYNREAQRRYKQKNKRKIAELKQNWVAANRSKYNQYFVDRRNRDVNFKIAHTLRRRLTSFVKNGSSVDNLGCSLLELKQYLESKFQPGMTWENHGEWHIDHIKLLSKFNLSEKEQLKQACHYTNLQPLWAKENLEKANTWH